MENGVPCQSCGIHLSKDEDFGINADGSKNSDYCADCYKDGKFTQDITMTDMIDDICAPLMGEADKDMEKWVREILWEWFLTLKRWETA
jgi:hypothetical protein